MPPWRKLTYIRCYAATFRFPVGKAASLQARNLFDSIGGDAVNALATKKTAVQPNAASCVSTGHKFTASRSHSAEESRAVEQLVTRQAGSQVSGKNLSSSAEDLLRPVSRALSPNTTTRAIVLLRRRRLPPCPTAPFQEARIQGTSARQALQLLKASRPSTGCARLLRALGL